MSSSKYCVYLTIYTGNKLPMFYIGSTTVSKFNNGYAGSVSSKKYGKIWKEEYKSCPELFKTKLLVTYDTRKEAYDKEEHLQKTLNVIKNPLYVNMSFANGKFTLKQHSPYTRALFKTRKTWNKGKTGVYSQRTLEKMSSAKKGKPGKSHTKETKEKLRGPNPKKALPGKLNGMWGKTHTDEVKAGLALIPVLHLKGKTYEEIHGKARAVELKKERSTALKTYLKQNPTARQGKNNSNAKSYKFTDPAGDEHIVDGELKTFCRANKLEFGAVIDCVKGRRVSYKGWSISYA